MADVAKQVEQQIEHRYQHEIGEPHFARCLSIADKFEAHGLGVVIEELMTTAELIEHRQREAEPRVDPVKSQVSRNAAPCSSTRPN